MVGLLTWPAYGTWFARPLRGWVDRGGASLDRGLPEPTRSAVAGRQRLKWPALRLDEAQCALVISDLGRIAALRGFDLLMAVAAADHVHALLACAADRDIPRLVQLIKGSLSRTLTVAAGDPPASSVRGAVLDHHKWWTRQYSFITIGDAPTLRRVVAALQAHEHAASFRAEGIQAVALL
jgi:REP element-mobilizing transposase RayT